MLTKKITTIITSGGIVAMLAVSPLAAFAQTVTTVPNKAANQTARLATLHTTADTAITSRVTDLNAAQTRINGLVKLTADQKSQFSGQVTTNVNGLNTLKAKVDADTDITTLRADYKTIFTTYRIYAEFLPQIHLLTASDTMDVTADKLSDLATKLQARIQSDGNPANLVSNLTDMQAKIADAKTQYASVQSEIISLTPQSYDSNPTGTSSTIKNARSQIQTGATDLKTAFADAKLIVQSVKTITNPTPTP